MPDPLHGSEKKENTHTENQMQDMQKGKALDPLDLAHFSWDPCTMTKSWCNKKETLTLLTQTHQYHYHIKTTSCSWDGPSKPFPNLSKFGRFQCIAFFMPRMHHFQVSSFVVFGCFRSHRFWPRHWQVTSAQRKFPEVSRDWTQKTRPFMRSPFLFMLQNACCVTLTQALITNSRVEYWGFWHLKRAKLLPPLAP